MNEKILVFIPMYNCEKQIVRVAEQLSGDISSYISEAIFVNNRSTDGGEAAIIEKLKSMSLPFPVKVLRNHENYGLGGSHKVAFNYAIKNGFDHIIVLHGDDQGSVADFIPVLKSGTFRDYDCVLGARFMKGAVLKGYSKLRIWGNYGFNAIFSTVVWKKIYDLGSGLNMYKVEPLKTGYYKKFPDTLYFNDCMILAYCYYNQKMLFQPITWREEDQISNNKLVKFSIALLKMLGNYIKNKNKYISSEMREKTIDDYKADCIFESKLEA